MNMYISVYYAIISFSKVGRRPKNEPNIQYALVQRMSFFLYRSWKLNYVSYYF